MGIIRVGLIGCGRVARWHHLPCFKAIPDVEVRALCDTNKARAEELAREWGVHHVYTDYEKLLSDSVLDLVDVCTPPFAHYEICAEALDRGFNVLVEKPATLSYESTQDLYRRSLRASSKLCAVHNFRFKKNVLKVLRFYNSGELGHIREAFSLVHACGSPKNIVKFEEEFGGPLYEWAFHMIDLQSYFCGNFKRVLCYRKKFNQALHLTTEIYALLEYANGITGIVDMACLSPTSRVRFDLCCTAAEAYMSFHPDGLTISAGYLTPLFEAVDQAKRILTFGTHILLGMKRYRRKYHFDLISKFIDSLRMNTPVPVSMESVLNTMKILEDLKLLPAEVN